MKKYLVIGNPINHSLSPKLHNFWIKQNKINAIYDKAKLSLDKSIANIKARNIFGEVKSKVNLGNIQGANGADGIAFVLQPLSSDLLIRSITSCGVL